MTPRPYLSRYQLVLWEKSRDRYMAEYFGDAKRFANRGMVLGEEIAKHMETGEETGDFAKDLVIAQMPKYEIRDQSQTVMLKVGKEVVPILIKPDSMKADWSVVAEAKTGAQTSPWTQRKVDEDDQLTFYATGVFIKTKKIPALELYYAPTQLVIGESGLERPELTGEVRVFKSQRHMSEILNMMMRMRKAWKEINEACDAALI